jgi:D-serine deaminase-like pyridoxal phosphate-dependent protein
MLKSQLDTPALLIDLDAFEANIADVMEVVKKQQIAWRPHAKCHKSAGVGKKLVAAGAIGLTCAKLGEAEVFAAAGIRDLLIANMLVGPAKVARLVELRKIADPIVCFDDLAQAEPISAAMAAAGLKVRAILEVDIGLSRVGVQPGEPMLKLAQAVAKLPGIEFVGVMGYEGHLLLIEDQAEKELRIREALGVLAAQRQVLEQAGLRCEIVSCGGTGSFAYCSTQTGITEIQCGGAIFMDPFYRNRCQVKDFRYSLSVLCTIVSRPTPERAVIDAGRKSMNMELHLPVVLGRDDVQVVSLSAEHGTLKLAPSAQGLKIGDRLELVPGYGDLSILLHERFYACRGEQVEAVIPVEGRGKLQ